MNYLVIHRIKIGLDTFHVTKRRTVDTKSNYNTFGNVFRNDEKTPLLGVCFNDNTSDKDIIEWGEFKTLRYCFDDLENLLSNGENPLATEIYNALTDSQKREYLEYRYESFCIGGPPMNVETCEPMTIEEVEEDLLYLINKY